jgi:CDP-diacylglycerol--glycerol-3-phosphate 3-phosphatidyltransferase
VQKLEIQLNLPNQLTLLRILLTPLFVYLIMSESAMNKQIALIVFVVAALTDWYDGWVARRFGYISRWGKFFDPLADKIFASAAMLAYVWLGLLDGWMVWIVIIRDMFMTALRSYAEYKDQPIVTSKSAQAKTFTQFVVIYYVLILYVGRNIPAINQRFGGLIDTLMDKQVLFGMMLLVTIAAVGTAIAYLWDDRKMLKELFSGDDEQPR